MSSLNDGRRICRRREGRIVAGVCAGLADWSGIDVTLVRLAFALFTVLGGSGVLLYLIAWMIIPEEGAEASIAEGLLNGSRDR